MHKFLRAAGFTECCTRREEEALLSTLQKEAVKAERLVVPGDTVYAEYRCELAPGMGVSLVGEEDEDGGFHLDYYFPYLNGDFESSKEECSVQRHAERETYAGMLDEYKVGISLIFYISNSMEYRIKWLNQEKREVRSVNLSGLSVEGKILLPIQKTARQIQMAKVAASNRNSLLEAAKHGDEDAMETLTIEDIDLYSKVSRRLVKEDVYSIIESCFMPYGIECDQYSIIGEIREIRMLTNRITQEEIYNLTIECNDIMFNVGIHKKDLLGEPMVGRRFKGQIWMMGKLNFA
ncbi:MAG: DUF3881 family protein [bacterium]|nr:DUF3881 family protein [bacterium]